MSYIVFFLLALVKGITSEVHPIHKRHEYQYTFKSPMITLPGTSDIPFFEYGGHIFAAPTGVRLTTSLPDQQGWIWSKKSSSFQGFNLEVVFKISGRGRFGADGLAIWMVESKSAGGLALGANNVWKGLGIFFDTYDNDGKGDNPAVIGIYNDGTKTYKPENDGRDISLGSCTREFRNRPYPVLARVHYYDGILDVSLSTGLSPNATEFELDSCFQANIVLPKADYFFGVSAATGALADDHDILKYEIHSLTDSNEIKKEEEDKRMQEQKKYEEEFQQNIEKLADTKEQKEKSSTNEQQNVDSELLQNLRVIWQELVQQNEDLKKLYKKVSDIHRVGGSKAVTKDNDQQMDSIKLEVQGIKSSIEVLTHKIENPGNSYQNQQLNTQIHNSIDGLKTEFLKTLSKVEVMEQKLTDVFQKSQEDKLSGRYCESSISLSTLIFVSILQIILIIGFMMYLKSKENSAKKFY